MGDKYYYIIYMKSGQIIKSATIWSRDPGFQTEFQKDLEKFLDFKGVLDPSKSLIEIIENIEFYRNDKEQLFTPPIICEGKRYRFSNKELEEYR